MWPILLKRFKLNDYFVLYICDKYIIDNKISISIYNNFVKSFKLEADDNYAYKVSFDKEKLVENIPKELESLSNKENKAVNDTDKNAKNSVNNLIEINQKSVENNLIDKEIIQHGIDFKLKERHVDRIKKSNPNLEGIEEVKGEDEENYFESSFLEENVKKYVEVIRKHESVKNIDKKIINELRESFKIAKKLQSFKVNFTSGLKVFENEEQINKPEDANMNNEINQSAPKLEIVPIDSRQKLDIEIYYKTLFDTIEEHLLVSQKSGFEEEKKLIFSNLRKEISIFPIIEGISLPNSRIKIIEEEWDRLLDYSKTKNYDLKLDFIEKNIGSTIVINKLFSPPMIGCMIGIIFGISAMNKIVYSTNHYISNITNIIVISYKAYVPLLFMCTGISLIASKGLNINMSFSKFHLLLSFVARAVIVPFLGIGFIALMKNYFGGIIVKDRMFRFAMYIVWALPASPNFIVVVNLVKYFREELSYVLFWHNALVFANLTLILLVYFLTVG